MAIVIPSKNIYQKENPKVRDNVIERIEVGAVEVEPDNEYETPVFNEKIIFDSTKSIQETQNDKDFSYVTMDGGTYEDNSYVPYGEAIVYNSITGIYLNGTVEFKKNDYKKNITQIFSSEEIPVHATSQCLIINGACQYSATIQRVPFEYTNLSDITFTSRTFEEYPSSTLNILPNEIIAETEDTIYKEYTNNMGLTAIINKTAYNKLVYEDKNGNLKRLNIIETDTTYSFDFCVLCGAIIDKCKSTTFIENLIDTGSTNIVLQGETTYYSPQYIEITVYGNTIGIDLVDKTVYINDETQKKVHSFDGNELMQTSNYYNSPDTNAITNLFKNTLNEYANGKETATIRCSISDYYDYDTDEKLISVDNSTGKMSFKLYDQVIPMVYTNNGDKPMSLYKNGTPKIFQVLGSKIYYDGAVWQELSLQEI